MSDASMNMKARLRADLTVALKARDAVATRAIRSLVSALDNAEAPPSVPGGWAPAAFGSGEAEIERLRLDAEQVRAIVAAEAGEREHAATELDRFGRGEAAAALRAEMAVVRLYLD